MSSVSCIAQAPFSTFPLKADFLQAADAFGVQLSSPLECPKAGASDHFAGTLQWPCHFRNARSCAKRRSHCDASTLRSAERSSRENPAKIALPRAAPPRRLFTKTNLPRGMKHEIADGSAAGADGAVGLRIRRPQFSDHDLREIQRLERLDHHHRFRGHALDRHGKPDRSGDTQPQTLRRETVTRQLRRIPWRQSRRISSEAEFGIENANTFLRDPSFRTS